MVWSTFLIWAFVYYEIVDIQATTIHNIAYYFLKVSAWKLEAFELTLDLVDSFFLYMKQCKYGVDCTRIEPTSHIADYFFYVYVCMCKYETIVPEFLNLSSFQYYMFPGNDQFLWIFLHNGILDKKQFAGFWTLLLHWMSLVWNIFESISIWSA